MRYPNRGRLTTEMQGLINQDHFTDSPAAGPLG